MGRKKSVVLMVLLTIVIVALCVLTVFPAFTFPWDTVKGWKPAVASLDAGAELRGGYYTYYYPQGVITASDYDDLSEEKKEDYVKYKGLYLNTDEGYEIFDDSHAVEMDEKGNAKVSDTFIKEFDRAKQTIGDRFAKKGYSQYRLAVVDDFVLRVEVPAPNRHENSDSPSDADASAALQKFSNLGALSVKKGEEVIAEFADVEANMKDFFQSFSVEEESGYVWISAKLTEKGKSVVNGMKDSLTNETPLNFFVGDTQMRLQVTSDYITSDSRIKAPAYDDTANRPLAETDVILLNSALEYSTVAEGDFLFDFVADPYKTIEEGNNMTFVYIALGVALLACLVLPIVFFGRYGVVSLYTTLSYLIVTGLFFAFVTTGIFEVTLGTLLTFLFGLVLTNACHAYVYTAIKKEVASGKTVASAVKKGYNKTVLHVVDVYAVLVLGALAMLIGVGGVFTMALQAIICLLTAAFCNLLWGRVINYIFLSASKDKYKYFRFAREEDEEDDED